VGKGEGERGRDRQDGMWFQAPSSIKEKSREARSENNGNSFKGLSIQPFNWFGLYYNIGGTSFRCMLYIMLWRSVE
jgi:hypothetical protein